MNISTAFVLGAGLGTRLRPLTARRPKPLIPVQNRPLIAYAFDHLLTSGVSRFVVNTHWCAPAYPAAFPAARYREAPVAFREEQPEVLETAGGIWNARDLLGDQPFLVYNGDIFSDLPLAPALAAHAASGHEVTLILRPSGGPLQVAFDARRGLVTDISGRVDASAGPRFLFTGIYVVSPEFVRRIPPKTKLSVVPLFCDMIRAGDALGGIVLDEGQWWDLGTREHYLAIHRELGGGRPCLHPEAEIAPTAKVTGATAIGAGARIGADASLHDCIIWEGAKIASGTLLNHCIVTDYQQVEGIHSHADF